MVVLKQYVSTAAVVGILVLCRETYWRQKIKNQEHDLRLSELKRRNKLKEDLEKKEVALMEEFNRQQEITQREGLDNAKVFYLDAENYKKLLSVAVNENEKLTNTLKRIEGGVIVPIECEHIVKFGLPSTENVKFHQGYVSAYDRRNRTALWSCEHISKNIKNVGNVDRVHCEFKEDESEPDIFRAKLQDYYRSGFDRGHLVPAGNMKFSQEAMSETFLLSNISPQVGNGFNRHYWARLEQFCRTLLEHYEDVYICTGPLYIPKQSQEDGKYYVKYQVIGDPPNVSVPTHFYKTILVTNPTKGLKELNGEPIVLTASFIIPNERINSKVPLDEFMVPLETLNRLSGLQFWSRASNTKALCFQERCKLPEPDWWSKSKDADFPIEDTISKFIASQNTSYSFPSTLSGSQRKQIHSFAEKHGLIHVSEGEGNNRHVVIRKQNNSQFKENETINIIGNKTMGKE